MSMNRLVVVAVLTCACGGRNAATDAGVDGPSDGAVFPDAVVDAPPPDGPSPDGPLPDAGAGVFAQRAYIKASNTGASDSFGRNVALSADGSTLAVSADTESSAARGINGDQADDSAMYAGAVYVFARTRTGWTQQAYLKASNTDRDDRFGGSIALSADGSTLAVGAYGEAAKRGGDPSDNSASDTGAVYVFTRSGARWAQQAYLKASNADEGDFFGTSLALSGDGATLAVGAVGEASATNQVDGDASDNSAPGAGAVYIFEHRGDAWTQQAYVKASNPDENDFFGGVVALSRDATTLAVAAAGESSASPSDGDPRDNSAERAGAVYTFIRAGASWKQEAYLKAANPDPRDAFGGSLALSADGAVLAAGAIGESSAGADPKDNSVSQAGAVYVFARAQRWSLQGYVKAPFPGLNDQFGASVALSADGAVLAVGAWLEDSAARGIDGDLRDEGAHDAGAAYVLRRTTTGWLPRSYVKASNTGEGDLFGGSVSLSGDGAQLVVGAYLEESAATGIDGNQADNSKTNAGAAYLFR